MRHGSDSTPMRDASHAVTGFSVASSLRDTLSGTTLRVVFSLAVVLATGGCVHDALVGRAVIPAGAFAAGPTSGRRLGETAINGCVVPFIDRQPVQGISAVHALPDGKLLLVSDNGFGTLENSSDYNLRIYEVTPHFQTEAGGSGTVVINGFVELRDPHGHVPFATTNHFTGDRTLTGADFDIESFRVAPDGTWWFGDEFGPFLLHTDSTGVVLEAPIPLPDFAHGGELRSPQNPFNEEASAIRVMNAVQRHAELHGARRRVVFSPWHLLLTDGDPVTGVPTRDASGDIGSSPASSEIFDVASIRRAGFPIVPYTVNDPPRMSELIALGVDGIISDRPDLLFEVIAGHDADGDGECGDLLDPDGLIDMEKIDAQGHRGARDLRPENTLPSMEAALDNLVTTLETDAGITKDGIPILDHDPYVESDRCRLANGAPYDETNEVLVRELTAAEIQSRFICDVLQTERPAQTNDLSLSPVTVAFAADRGLPSEYVMPTLAQLFEFTEFYAAYYRNGPGSAHADATRRWKNAGAREIQHRGEAESPVGHRCAGPGLLDSNVRSGSLRPGDHRRDRRRESRGARGHSELRLQHTTRSSGTKCGHPDRLSLR